jgi:glycogen operon protein
VFRRRRWFQGRPIRGTVDIGWYRPDGDEMDDADWEAGFARALAVYLNGLAIPYHDERGQPVLDDCFLLLLSAAHDPIDWTLPAGLAPEWSVVLDTTTMLEEGDVPDARKVLTLAGRSAVLLVARQPDDR